MHQIDPIICGFLDYSLKVKKLKPLTVNDIRCTFNKVIKYMAERGEEDFLWEQDLSFFVQYVNYLRSKNEKGTGINKQLSHLRSLLDYCWRVGHSKQNVLMKFEVRDNSPRYMARFLSEEETTRLIRACSKASFESRQERLMILLLYGLGLRTSELCNIKIQDIDFEKQNLFVKGKFDIERRLPIPGGVWVELLAFIHEASIKRGVLFKTKVKKKQIGPVDVGSVIRKYVQLVRIGQNMIMMKKVILLKVQFLEYDLGLSAKLHLWRSQMQVQLNFRH